MTTQPASKFTIADDFPPVDYDQWRDVVEESLQGVPFERKLVTRTYDGIDIQPVYSRQDELGPGDPLGVPGIAPFVRGSSLLGAAPTGWDLRPEYAHPDLATTNGEILEDLAGGATSVLLQLDAAARSGCDPDAVDDGELPGRGGVMVYSASDLDACFADVKLEMIGVALEAGAAFVPAAATLVALWQMRGIAPDHRRGAFNADPLATLAREGQLPLDPSKALESLAELAQWSCENLPHVTAVGVDTSPYHNAGATSTQDIAFALATGVEYLRAMTERGLDAESAAGQILFRIGLGTHHFLAIAKLRAARWLWWRVIDACGGTGDAGAMQIHARTSPRVLTRRDPHVNMLRNVVAIFAAGLGGAKVMTPVPFDSTTGLPDRLSRRVARNTVLVLQEEAHLNRILDPAGGSWFLDRLTRQLAESAWEVFQQIESQGGMLAALRSGWVLGQIDQAYALRAKDIARRKVGITGVSEFPDISEQPIEHPAPDLDGLRSAAIRRVATSRPTKIDTTRASQTATLIDAASGGASIGQMAQQLLCFGQGRCELITPMPFRSFAAAFEELRAASDAWLTAHGKRPRAFLANMGSIAHHTARATYSKNFLEAGGFDVVTNDGFQDAQAAAAAFAESGASIAVICSSDKLYPELVPGVTARLKAAGARSVVLAGNPGDNESAWREAGVDRFIFIKCDVLAVLRELLAEEGVLESKG